jgi:hypothetical protein
MTKSAIQMAAEAHRAPSRYKNAPLQQMPNGMLTVIKVAAGDEDTTAMQAELHRLTPEQIKEAAKHFLFRVLLDPESRGLRMLGLSEGATEAEIKDHKRWLLKWLHPDRNPSTWEQALFHKINSVELDPGGSKASPPEIGLMQKPAKQLHNRSRPRMIPTEIRQRDTSKRKLILRLIRPLIASATLIAALLWLISMRESLHDGSLSLFGQRLGG